jgi:outer membrane protein assembly factor BamB
MAHAVVKGTDAVILGTMRSAIGGYPYLLALDAGSGKLIWSSKLEENPAATVTMSPTVYQEGAAAFVGLSSLEEARAASVNYTCCTFRGSFVKARRGAARGRRA